MLLNSKIDKVIFLGLPDATVKENVAKLFEKSLSLIAKIAPDHIVSFGPDGISAHWDHITVGKVALRIAKTLKIPTAAFTMSDERIRMAARVVRMGLFAIIET